MTLGYYEIRRAANNEYYFVLKAANHQVILKGDCFKSVYGAENGIESIQANCKDETNFECRHAKSGGDYFVLKAKDNEVIGVGETYRSTSALQNGIASVMRNGITEDVKDFSLDPAVASA